MTQGIEFLELIYGQLHGARIIRSKGEFSERLLGKSPSYLTSMRAKQRVISSDVIMGLGDNLMAAIDELGPDTVHVESRATLRRAVAHVNNYLADQTIPGCLKSETSLPCRQGGHRNFTTWLLRRISHLLRGNEITQ
ncbi:hypothetical protein DEVEQU_01022 [Devosia equisanguinis]|uniref:Uncharacterized protein n=1 Tax=Devosia equisanguinis TaxID=2490941 RepID=A0A3S4GGB8_9HYPH|nr:DUF6626 family protein [Devosia equisanguinis]VDS03893.1 hypothetical protein DEVEQU_01022 [Devosia equisanguinis]